MFTLYLACLIFGGILLGASLIGFGDHHNHSDGSFDSPSDMDLDAAEDINHDIDSRINHPHDLQIIKSSTSKISPKLFSFQNLVFFTTFFGMTGTVLKLLDTNSILTFISSLGLGAFSYIFGYQVMKYLKNSETGEDIRISELIGKTGVVSIGISKDKNGKVLINTGSYSREYTAVLSEASKSDSINKNGKILVIDISGNNLIIDNFEV